VRGARRRRRKYLRNYHSSPSISGVAEYPLTVLKADGLRCQCTKTCQAMLRILCTVTVINLANSDRMDTSCHLTGEDAE